MGRRRHEFIARREHLGITQEQLAFRTGAAVATVSSWERGLRRPKASFRPVLAEVLQVSLVELDRLLGIKAPIQLNGHAVPRWLSTYESLVQAAGRLCEVELSAIPALLQTKSYADAVERASELVFTDHEVIERIDVRAERQKVLYREPDPLELVVVLADGVLCDLVGGPEVMAEQLDHLVEIAQRPNVDLRIIGRGRAPAAIGGFELLTRIGDFTPFMAVTASVDGPNYIDVEQRVANFVARFNHLFDTALSPTESIRRIQDIRKTYR